MTRDEFLSRLKRGLAGLPVSSASEILTDYEAHFDDGLAAGRTEAEISAKLGDPDRLARELKAEAGIQRWHQEKNPSAAAGAVFAVLGLGALDILILLPILMGVIGIMFAVLCGVVIGFFGGAVIMIAAPFSVAPGGIAATILAGLGVMAGSTFVGALLAISTILLVNGLVWFARLHYRLLKPALETNAEPMGARS
ncbi:DUF1700 domain-containing protein [Brevundimonas variabilis]|uniref:Putative membrane protein n=1 Tax=Brevundimonas variabilis TaxID=74312 RepID=A0A7W9FD02_9CAUL|nr:DUF1700 domain-containing protein [Brevundimonas variabilis]MBB5744730.1 putative membrane protein [Brevundimonas variabilis]